MGVAGHDDCWDDLVAVDIEAFVGMRAGFVYRLGVVGGGGVSARDVRDVSGGASGAGDVEAVASVAVGVGGRYSLV